MCFSSTAKCWDNHVIPRLAGEGEIYRLIRSSRCSPRGSDYAILPIILKRRIYDTRLLSLFCGFISIFIFLSWAASSVRLSLRCFSVFCLTAILCFHGASIYIYLYSISICSYYTRDFPRLFFPLVFSSLVVYYFMCYIIYIFVRLWRFLMFGGYLSNIP